MTATLKSETPLCPSLAQGIPIYHPPVVKVGSHKPLLTKAMKNRKAAPVKVSLAEILWWCYLRSLDTFYHLTRNFSEKKRFWEARKIGSPFDIYTTSQLSEFKLWANFSILSKAYIFLVKFSVNSNLVNRDIIDQA